MPRSKKGKLSFLKAGVAQVGLIVKDLDHAVEQWFKLFGIGPWHFYTYGKPLVKRIVACDLVDLGLKPGRRAGRGLAVKVCEATRRA